MNLEEFSEEEEPNKNILSDSEFLDKVAINIEPFVIFPELEYTIQRLKDIAYRIRSLEK